MQIACGGILLAVWPATQLFSASYLLAGALLLLIPAAVVNGCYQSAIIELFQTRLRFTGLAVAHNIGSSVFSGLSPVIMEKMAIEGLLVAPIILAAIAAGIALFGSLNIPCNYQMSLETIGKNAPIVHG